MLYKLPKKTTQTNPTAQDLHLLTPPLPPFPQTLLQILVTKSDEGNYGIHLSTL